MGFRSELLKAGGKVDESRPVEHAPGRGRREHPSPRVIDLDVEAAAPLPGGRGGKVRVLVVEDDVLFANLVLSILQEASDDFEVEYVPRLSTALARLVRDHIDLILADLNLPDSNGPVTVRFLRRAAPDTPVIVLSGVDDVQVALDAVREGADEYVVKGRFSVDSLVWLVRLVLERHRRLLAGGDTYVDPFSGFANLSALQVVGRHLLRVADRTGLHLGVVFLGVEAAPRGPWADWERLVVWLCDLLQGTLRRCDVLSRIGRGELAVLLVSEGALVGAVDRLRQAITEGGAGAYVRIGFAPYGPDDHTTLDELLEGARSSAHGVFT